MRDSAVIIPAFKPSPSLIDYCKSLLAEGFPRILVVNDGSGEKFDFIFAELRALDGCTVLEHEVNRGKGRALKTAFAHLLEQGWPVQRVVTADADGQHTVEDVCRVDERCAGMQEGIVLGVRNFTEPHVPRRSYIGNRITSVLFRLLFGSMLQDTQTGLRGIPAGELSRMIRLKGERYEYEMNMLIYITRNRLPIREVPIQTVYFNNNEGSHYSSIRDSLRIFRRMMSGYFNGSDRKDMEQP